MSVILTGVGVVLATAAASAGGFLLISRFVPDRWLVADSEAASALYATIGMAYAILIAIGAIAVWEPHSDAASATSTEAAALTEAYRSTQALPPGEQAAIQQLIARYTSEVVSKEWPALRVQHTANAQAAATFEQLRTWVEAVNPKSERQASYTEQLRSQLLEAADARRSRIADASAGLPQPLWPVLALGGLVSIGFLYLFGLERTFPNGLMMATVGGMIATVLFVIHEMEYPFSRGMAIPPDAFRDALATFSPAGPPHS